MLSYPSGMTMSSRALNLLADLLRGRRTERGTRWRKLPAGRQALLVVAHLRKNDTYAELACGFGVGTSTAACPDCGEGGRLVACDLDGVVIRTDRVKTPGPNSADPTVPVNDLVSWTVPGRLPSGSDGGRPEPA